MTSRSINDLCPSLQIVARELFAQVASIARGWTSGPIVTYRDAAAQNKAHASGFSNAGAGQSPHNICGENGPSSWAFDYGVFEADGSYVQNGSDERYRLIGGIGKSLGLEWGGDWHRPDWDHLELPGWKYEISKQQPKENV